MSAPEHPEQAVQLQRLVEEGDAAIISRALTTPLRAQERERLLRRLVELELRAGRLERLPDLLLQLPLEQDENQALLKEIRASLEPDEAARALGLAALMEKPAAGDNAADDGLLPPPPPDDGVTDLQEQALTVAPTNPAEATRLLLRAIHLANLENEVDMELCSRLLDQAAAFCPVHDLGLALPLVDALDRGDLLLQSRPLLGQIGEAASNPLVRRDLLGRMVRASLRRDAPYPELERALADQWYAPTTEQSWPAEWLTLDPQNHGHRARLMLGLVPGSEGDGRASLLGELLRLRNHLPGGEALAARLLRELCEVRPDHPDARAFLASEAGASAEVPMEMLQRAVDLHPDDADLEAHYQKSLERMEAWDELHRRLKWSLSRTLTPRRRVGILLRLDELLTDRQGRPAEGAIQLERALQLRPGDPDVLQRLERRYTQLERWPALARVLCQRAAGVEEGPARRELLLGAALLQRDKLNNPEGALELARQVLDATPQDQEAASLVEALLDRLGRWSERLELLRRRLESESDSAEVGRLNLVLGRLYLERAGDPEGAAPHFAQALRLGLRPEESLALLRQVHAGLGQLERLERLLRGLAGEQELPLATRALFLCEVARILEEHLQDEVRGEATYRQALELDPASLPALRALRQRAEEQERWDELAELCQREIAQCDEDSLRLPLLLKLGQLHHQHLGQPDTALRVLTQALTLDPGNLQATRLLSELHFQQGEWEEAAEHTARLIHRGSKDQPGLHELHYRLAFAREHQGHATEVFNNYIKALTLAPSYLPAMERLVPLCYARRQWETTRRIATTILDLHGELKSNTEQAALWLQIGLCELHLAQRDIAAHRLRQMALPPGGVPSSSSEAWYEVADMWAAREFDPRLLPQVSSSTRDRIREAAHRCLALWPGHPDAHQLLAGMAVVERNWPGALEQIEKAAKSEALPAQQRARLWSFSGEIAMRQKLAPLLAQECFKHSLELLPDQPWIQRKVEILSRSTVEDLSLGIPPQWEVHGVPSRLDWLTEPPDCEKNFDERNTIPYDNRDEEKN